PAVDLRRAGSALAGLAVPTARQIGSLLRLDPVDRIEHDHAFGHLGPVVLEAPFAADRAPDAECRRGHAPSSTSPRRRSPASARAASPGSAPGGPAWCRPRRARPARCAAPTPGA